MSELVGVYGSTLTLKNCIIGKNLNLFQIRGFASLETLADISAADVYDQEENEYGTQRELKPAHAKEAYKYAIGAVEVDSSMDPRAFPEVILNVRTPDLIQCVQDGIEFSIDSLDFDSDDVINCDVIINIQDLHYPAVQYEPEISRVDGNHRLSSVPKVEDREEVSFPIASFAIFVGLTKDQERKIFADINGNQAKMNTSHLLQILAKRKGDSSLYSESTRPAWFATVMSSPGHSFEGRVFMGGAKKGVKKLTGGTLPITFAALVSMMKHTLGSLKSELIEAFPTELCVEAENGNDESMLVLKQSAEGFVQLFEYFWQSVQEVFPEAWNDTKKSSYVLYDAVGNVALSMLAGDIISDVMKSDNSTEEDIKTYIKKEVSNLDHAGVTLAKSDYPGFAGLAGAKRLYEKLISARSSGKSGVGKTLKILRPKNPSLLSDD